MWLTSLFMVKMIRMFRLIWMTLDPAITRARVRTLSHGWLGPTSMNGHSLQASSNDAMPGLTNKMFNQSLMLLSYCSDSLILLWFC